LRDGKAFLTSLIDHALATLPFDVNPAPTQLGTTAWIISRCKSSVWIIAPSRDRAACQSLAFSYGVQAVDLVEEPDDWRRLTARWLRQT